MQLERTGLIRNAIRAAFELDSHCMRVLSMMRHFAEQHSMTRAEIEMFSKAGLVHDVGKIDARIVPLWASSKVLSGEERRKVREIHISEESTERGIELLGIDPESVPEEAWWAMRLHHIRKDGSGYPREYPELPEMIWVLVILDAVEAMTSGVRFLGRETKQHINPLLHAYEELQGEVSVGKLPVELVRRVFEVLFNTQPKTGSVLPVILGELLKEERN